MGTPPSPQMHVSHSAAYTTTMYLVANTARAVRRSAHPSHVWYCVRAYCPPDSGWPFLGRGVSLATGQRSCGCAAMGREDTPMLRARSLSTHPQGRANGRGRSPAGTVVPNCAQEPILTDLHAYRCLPPLRRKLFVLSVPSPEAQSDMGDTALRFLRLHLSANTLHLPRPRRIPGRHRPRQKGGGARKTHDPHPSQCTQCMYAPCRSWGVGRMREAYTQAGDTDAILGCFLTQYCRAYLHRTYLRTPMRSRVAAHHLVAEADPPVPIPPSTFGRQLPANCLPCPVTGHWAPSPPWISTSSASKHRVTT